MPAGTGLARGIEGGSVGWRILGAPCHQGSSRSVPTALGESVMRRLIVLAGLVGSLAILGTGVAQAASTLNQDIPISGIATNPCNGELVDYAGFLHQNTSLTLDHSGGTHVDVHQNLNGATGRRRNDRSDLPVTASVHESFNTSGLGGSDTFTLHANTIGQGKVPNFTMDILQHITVNANGDVTTLTDRTTTACH